MTSQNVVPFEASKLPALQMDEAELMRVLSSSLYPGAKPESIKLVIGYCKAAGLDPMQKPVHLVPMKVKTGKVDDRGWDIKEDRDVVMPGVGLYRTQAARSGAYLGMSEPEFGPTKTLSFKKKVWEDGQNNKRVSRMVEDSIEYPEWCKVTVRRSVAGQVAEFTAKEYWLENYATTSNDSNAPNAMWARRPIGQLTKCAEAQALRKAFPELVGSAPTAEELEGKSLDLEEHTQQHRTVEMPHGKVIDATLVEKTGDNKTDEAGKDAKPLTASQRKMLRAKMTNAALSDGDFEKKFGKPLDDESWTFDSFATIQAWILDPTA